MTGGIRRLAGSLARSIGLRPTGDPHRDLAPEFLRIHKLARDFTATSIERMYALYDAVRYVERAGIAGDIVECGVFKGGSVMMAALTLDTLGRRDRSIYLYDTFAGMTMPHDRDVDHTGRAARAKFEKSRRASHNDWCFAPIDDVRRNVRSTGYPENKFVFVEGDVEKTIPGTRPDTISLLRLDTDWYASTYHELTHLYPRLSRGGVLLLDDYGKWSGFREAVDQYFREIESPCSCRGSTIRAGSGSNPRTGVSSAKE